MRVSVVIPAYQSGQVIGRAIRSALRQSHPPDEILVVDDGSTDDTSHVADACGPLVRVIRKENAGAAAARNRGIVEARSELIAFLDADDEWLPNKLAAQVAHLSTYPHVGLVATGSRVVNERGETLQVVVEKGCLAGVPLERLLLRNVVPTSSVVVRREILESLGTPFDTRFVPIEDWHLWLRVAGRAPVAVLPEMHTTYHVLGDSLTRRCSPERYHVLYEQMYEDLRSEAELAPLIARYRKRLQASVHLMVGHHRYYRGQGIRARVDMLKAIVTAPIGLKWSSVLPILLLPRRTRDFARLHYTRRFGLLWGQGRN